MAVLGGPTPHETAVAIGQRIVDMIGEPFHLGVDGPVRIGASVGIARAGHGTDVGRLLCEADAAMYDAKVAGRGRFCVAEAGSPPPAPARNLRAIS